MTHEALKSIRKELVDYCAGDWLDLASAIRLVAIALHAPNDEAAIGETINIVRHLLEEGLCVVGELPDRRKKNFEMWSGDVNELTTRITDECQRIRVQAKRIYTGDVCWLALTPKGEQVAKENR
jgi:hypothetical protein